MTRALLLLICVAAAATAAACGGEGGPVGSSGDSTTSGGGRADGTGVAGRVVDASDGEPVEDATVEAASEDRPAKPAPMLGVLTNAQGRYSWPLTAGIWRITVSARRHQPVSKTVEVLEGRRVALDFELQPDP